MKKIALSILTAMSIISTNAQSDPTPKPSMEDYVGKYVFPEGSVVPDVTVTINSNVLYMASVQGSSVLNELGRDSFQIVEFNGIAVFKRGDDKKVSGVHIEAAGYVLEGQKQSNGLWTFTYYLRPNRELLASKK